MHRTDAHALVAILTAVNQSDQNTLQKKWAEVLDAPASQPEFAMRHSEVVGLLTGTLDKLAALPEDRQQMYSPFIMHWWTAVIMPHAIWNAQQTGSQVISVEHVTLLHGLGDIVEARMDRTSAAPGAFNLDSVSEQCRDWLIALGAPGSLPEPMRQSLVRSIQHVAWLIENVELFGAARVARAANSVTGEIVLATPYVRREERKTWAVRFGSWTAVLAAFSAFVTASTVAIERTEHLTNVVTGVAVQVVDALESDDPAPPALGTSDDRN